jgi:L-seryl-tRNA(Ser) seleniumtransferase
VDNQHNAPHFRVIPSIEQVRQRPGVGALRERFGDAEVTGALRAAADALRARLAAGDAVATTSETAAAWLETDALARLERQLQPSLVRVINATGVIVHTNLGRSPLSSAALARVSEMAGGYVNLEYDVEAGRRGARDVHAEALLCRLTGAEAAVVVNNCAAATMIALAALARGREVVISRAELVEIGGGFRVPDVMAQSGARLREVGTTNRTRVGDYALAIGDRTGALLRVHPSNFRIEGFTERATLDDLVALARRFGVPLIEDLGSGHVTVAPTGVAALDREASVGASVAAGVDVVCFSGDKLLGGPQAGIIVGRTESIGAIRKHPLMRALRVDKLTCAALEATLVEHLAGRATDTVPVLRMATMPAEAIAVRAEILASTLRQAGFSATVTQGVSTIGGGSAPGSELPTALVAIAHPSLSADELEGRLRRAPTPVIARIEEGRVVIDLRTVDPHDDVSLTELVAGAGSREGHELPGLRRPARPS